MGRFLEGFQSPFPRTDQTRIQAPLPGQAFLGAALEHGALLGREQVITDLRAQLLDHRRGLLRPIVVEVLATLGQFLVVVGRLLTVGILAHQGFGIGFVAVGEETVERVIIGRGDGIELVVVAAGALNGEPHESAGGHVDPVVDDVRLIIEKPTPQGQEPHGGQGLAIGLGGHLVSSQLLDNEPVIGQIAVEGVDHPVAVGVAVGVATLLLEDVALAVGITGYIQPMPSPALTVGLRGEQSIHHPRVSLLGAVLEEGFHFFRRRRQAGQIVGRAAEKRAAIGLRSGRQALGLQGSEDEPVHAAARPGRLADRRLGRHARGLERPVAGGRIGLGRGGSAGPWIRCSGANPGLEVGDLFRLQSPALGRHDLHVRRRPLHHLDQ